jgi:quercetin dioxygenase-like cupin family protein
MSSQLVNKPVLAATEAITQTFDWGYLNWFVNAQIGNSSEMTLGKCTIKPGQENPRHYHPNCEEILQVISGTIAHTMGDDVFEMGPGDTIVIPPNIMHNARNVGSQDAVMTIAFSSADRQTIGEF